MSKHCPRFPMNETTCKFEDGYFYQITVTAIMVLKLLDRPLSLQKTGRRVGVKRNVQKTQRNSASNFNTFINEESKYKIAISEAVKTTY